MLRFIFDRRFIVAAALALNLATAHAADSASVLDTAKIEQLTGLKGIFFQGRKCFQGIQVAQRRKNPG